MWVLDLNPGPMPNNWMYKLSVIFAIFTAFSYGAMSEKLTTCVHHNATECARNPAACHVIKPCAEEAYCYAVWTNVATQQGGCQYGRNQAQCESTECIAHHFSRPLNRKLGNNKKSFYCCCKGDNCNNNTKFSPKMEERTVKLPVIEEDLQGDKVVYTAAPKRTITCDYYHYKECETQGKCNVVPKVCPADSDGKRQACFASWRNDTSRFMLIHKGCWASPRNCHDATRCISGAAEPTRNQTIHFCCCVADDCNRNFSFVPTRVTTQTIVPPATTVPARANQQLYNVLCYSLVPIAGIFIIVVSVFWLWRRHAKYAQQVPTHDPDPNPYPNNMALGLPGHCEILELRAYGRFGAVWKAILNKESVAVKIFPLQDKQSWLMERDIYSIKNLTHDNVLRFIACDCKQDNITTEFWLVTEFHERGSLYDYLKSNTFTWTELCNLGESMAEGLAYLHEDIPPGGTRAVKPAIAHRDFKSKNVLLKKDLTACIADFGLAMRFDCSRGVSDAQHAQVGTRRYMAPEVLEGAIAFSRDAFLRIDVYACGLVLWEIVSRCDIIEDMGEYQLPFEDSVGLHPTLEAMQDLVVHKKSRPPLRDAWLQHQGLEALCVTIEECWDHDSEGRLSAQCVKERISQMSQSLNISTSSSLNDPTQQNIVNEGLNIMELDNLTDEVIDTSAPLPVRVASSLENVC